MEDIAPHIVRTWQAKRLITIHCMLLLLVLLWSLPITHVWCQQLDYILAIKLNQSLTLSSSWLYFWSYLNHPHETWLNLVVMFSLNCFAIYQLPAKSQQQRAWALVIYFWLFFQIGMLISHGIFTDLLAIHRPSPSLLIKPWIIISKATNISNLKDYSDNSFPAGHTFVLVYWAAFTALYAPKITRRICYSLAILLCLPRLFSGAHWVSDIIFTIVLALLWLQWARATPLYGYGIQLIEQSVKKRFPINENSVY